MNESIYRTAMRSHACGELTAEHANADVILCGWVASRRDHGGVTFIDLRDREGIVQVVFHPEDAADAHTAAQRLSAEDVVQVTGRVHTRPAGMTNPQLPTGEVEVAAASVEILSEAETPPFPVEDRVEAGEELRLRYRYLDLRRHEMTEALRTAIASTRSCDHMTPSVSSRSRRPCSHARRRRARGLPRAVATLAGTLRAAAVPAATEAAADGGGTGSLLPDRAVPPGRGAAGGPSFEFTQLDVEMSFVDQEDVFAGSSPCTRASSARSMVWRSPRRSAHDYDEMLRRFGSDKPDLRYGLELADLGPCSPARASTRSRPCSPPKTARSRTRGAGAAASSQASSTSSSRMRRVAARPVSSGRRRGRRRALPGGETPVEDEVDGVLTMTGASEGTWSASWPTMSIGCTWPSTARVGTWPIDSTWFPRESGATSGTRTRPCSTGARRRGGSPTTILHLARRATTSTRRRPRPRDTTSS